MTCEISDLLLRTSNIIQLFCFVYGKLKTPRRKQQAKFVEKFFEEYNQNKAKLQGGTKLGNKIKSESQ